MKLFFDGDCYKLRKMGTGRSTVFEEMLQALMTEFVHSSTLRDGLDRSN